MKNITRINVIFAIALFSGVGLFAQCIPDAANCEDTGGPGQFCPMDLPQAGINVLYDEVVTIIAPGTFPTPIGEVAIEYIEIDSVKNLPPGIDYFPNADRFYPDTAYCIQLTGTPTQTGIFALSIHIGATVDVMGIPTKVPVVDDTSIVITVVEVLGVTPNQMSHFQVFRNAPNPFTDMTRLGYYTPFEEQVELSVYNILGVMVHQESELVAPGRHNFSFDGSKLEPGTYLYRVKTREAYFKGKLMKSR